MINFIEVLFLSRRRRPFRQETPSTGHTWMGRSRCLSRPNQSSVRRDDYSLRTPPCRCPGPAHRSSDTLANPLANDNTKASPLSRQRQTCPQSINYPTFFLIYQFWGNIFIK
tara:strand:- start:18440 stop:18775 length:336 start_codon:yes stop_codon:yes gene_type:complete